THASKAGAIGRLAAISCKIPIIVHTFHGHVFHGYFNPIIARIYKTVERYLAKKSNAIVAISELQKNELVNIYKIVAADKISVIPLGFDLEQFTENSEEKRRSFRSKFNIRDEELAIGIIGRLVPIKNHQLFIKAAQHVQRNSKTAVRFVIIGDGESKSDIQEQCIAADLSYEEKEYKGANVIFTSWIKEVDWALAGLDLVCLTSLNEGTPVSLIEAQAAGKPIVSTEVGGIKNVVVPNKSALLSPIENESLFFTNLLKLVDNQELRKEMSGIGRAMVIDKFSYHVLVKNMEGLYSRLIKQ
ncbi:MAG: glycosyltransferase involved in cell wall biosynthesis, partial [Salibacteraceae bacterium]